MRSLLLLLPLVLAGCPKGGVRAPKASDLANTKWRGVIDVKQACDAGSYTGGDLNVCVYFAGGAGSALQAHVDWDASELREGCDYFLFSGAVSGSTVLLKRTDQEAEVDDTFELDFLSRDTIRGTFSVHPSCGEWPVVLLRVDPESSSW